MREKIRKIMLGKFTSLRDFYLFSALFAGFFVVSSLTLLFNDYFAFRSEIISDVKEQNERVRRKITDSLLFTQHLMGYIAKQAVHHGTQDLKFINNLLMSYRIPSDNVVSWSAFSWADEKHLLRISSNSGIMRNSIDLSKRDYMPLTMRFPETLQLGKPSAGATSGLWSIPMGYGVVDRNRKYLGTLVTGIVINGVKTQIEKTMVNHNVSFAVISLKGEVVTKSDDFDIEENRVFFDEFMQEIKSAIFEKSFLYKTAYYQRLGDYPYGIVTFYSSKSFAEIAKQRFIIYLAAVFAASAFAAFMLYTFHENVVHPIIQLSKAAKKIYHGETKYDIPESNISEINDLAKTLGMIDKAWRKKLPPK